MGTTSQTTGQFAPSGMSAYNTTQPAWASAAQGYMQNPFSNPFFQAQQQMGTNQAQQLGGTQMSNITNNAIASGTGGGINSPYLQEMQQNQARANSGLQAQLGFMSPVQNALGMQQSAMGQASQYKPLQTGSTQSVSGLGSWLPQLISGGMGALMGMPGLGGGGGGSMSPSGSVGSPFFGANNSLAGIAQMGGGNAGQLGMGFNYGSSLGSPMPPMGAGGYNMPGGGMQR